VGLVARSDSIETRRENQRLEMKTAGKDFLFERDKVLRQLKDAIRSGCLVSAIAQAQVDR
jgi:hypothetical protein